VVEVSARDELIVHSIALKFPGVLYATGASDLKSQKLSIKGTSKNSFF